MKRFASILNYLHNSTQAQSIENIMVGVKGEGHRYNVAFSKEINQKIERLINEYGFVLQKPKMKYSYPTEDTYTGYYLSDKGVEYVMANRWERFVLWLQRIGIVWIPISIATLSLALNVLQWYSTTSIQTELQSANSKINKLSFVVDSLRFLLKK